MDRIRTGVSVFCVVLLGGLYAASQAAALNGPEAAAAYSRWIDRPWMHAVAASLLLGSLALAVFGKRAEGQ